MSTSCVGCECVSGAKWLLLRIYYPMSSVMLPTIPCDTQRSARDGVGLRAAFGMVSNLYTASAILCTRMECELPLEQASAWK